MTIVLGSLSVLLGVCVVQSTLKISALEERLTRLEVSHATLGRATFDVGAASLDLNDPEGPSLAGRTQVALLELKQDGLLRAAIERPSSRSVEVRSSAFRRNAVERGER